MKKLTALTIWILALCWAAGCSRTAATTETVPQVSADHVVFAPDAPQLATLTTAPAKVCSTTTHLFTGRIVWDENTTVRIYSPVAGRVRSVNFELGDVVAAGDALAVLDSPDYGQAQADVRKAAADLLLAERGVTRMRELVEHGAAAAKDLEAAEDTLAGAQSESQRASARLALFGSQASSSTVDGIFSLRSPIGGVVVEKNVNLGQELRPDLMLANASQLLAPQFVVANPRRLWVLLDATEMDAPLLKPGLDFAVRSRAYGARAFRGRIDNVGNSLDATTRTIKARGTVENPDLLLKAEMYVEVEVQTDTGSALVIPSSSVFTVGDRSCVFVETKVGSFERRTVEVGQESAGTIMVREGLHEGEQVLTEGCLLLESVLESGGRT